MRTPPPEAAFAAAGPARTARPAPLPGPRGFALLRALRQVRADRIGFVVAAAREHGDWVAFRLGPRRLFLLSHPEHFRHVLVENPGGYVKGAGLADARPLLGEGLLTGGAELAAAQRHRLQEAFRPERCRGFAAATIGAAGRRLERWREAARRGAPLALARELALLTLEILDETLLGAELAADGEQILADLGVLTGWATRRMAAPLRLPLALPTPGNRRARRALARLDALAARALPASGGERGAVAAAPGLDAAPAGLRELLLAMAAEPGPRPAQARDEFLTFLLAGHETTAAALAWSFSLLSDHPEADRRLAAEVTAVAGDAPLAADHLPHLSFTRAVIEEAIRLYPPVWMIPRRTLTGDVVAGAPIPAGAEVLLCAYTLHRHPAFWPAPERFDPGRFEADCPARAAGAYLPFGGGPRSCLGSRFALQEATLVLATIAREVRLERLSPAPPAAEGNLTLRPRGDLPVRCLERPRKRA